MTTTTSSKPYASEIKTFTDWTYYLGIFDGIIKTSAAAVYNDDWIFKVPKTNDKDNVLELLESIYELVAKVVTNLNQGIDTMNAGTKITYTLVPYTIPMGNFLPLATSGQSPSVIKDAWQTVKPGITLLLPGLAKEPMLLETVQALLAKGEKLVEATAELMSGSDKNSGIAPS